MNFTKQISNFTHYFLHYLATSIMAEKLCLQWNDFKNNTIDALGRLTKDNDFSDVTLACEDGQQVEAHKVILAVSSPFFQSLLKKNRHPNPLIYMRGVKSEDLRAIIDFLYCGEASVCQDNLEGFLAIAEELQLQGLTGQANNDADACEETIKTSTIEREFQNYSREPQVSKYPRPPTTSPSQQIIRNESLSQNGTLAVVNSSAGDMQTLNETINTLMEKCSEKDTNGRTKYRCKECGKENSYSNNIRQHIEATHLEGVSIQCSQCEKTFSGRNTLSKHRSRHHNNEFD